jgi:nucleoside-diphosphate-sugar epimerase
VRRLAESEAEVWAGVYPAEAAERIAALPLQIERVALDMQDRESVRRVVKDAAPDVVFHLAAIGVTDSRVDPSSALAVNTGGTVHLLEALREQGVGRGVLVGTCHEYGARETIEGVDPFNAYAASKVAAWAFGRMYWRAHGLPIITVRLFQVYGPGQPEHTLIPAAIRTALAGEDFSMTPGEQGRDFVYVADVVEGMFAAARAPQIEGQSLDLGTGVVRPIRQVVESIWQLAGGTGRIRPGDLPYRSGEVMSLVADADRTARLTGWRAGVELEEGLRRTIDGVRSELKVGC